MMRRRRAELAPLAKFPPFDHCRPAALTPLLPHVDQMRVAEGTVLARESWTVREVLFVLRGEVIATRADGETHRFGPGAQLGVAELLSGGSHPATLVAGPDLEVLVIYGPAYRWAAQTLRPVDA